MSKYSQSPKVTESGLPALSAQMKRLRLKFLKSVKSESLDQALETLRLNLAKEKDETARLGSLAAQTWLIRQRLLSIASDDVPQVADCLEVLEPARSKLNFVPKTPTQEQLMKSFIRFADTLSTSMGKAFSWCIVILMGGTVYEVVMAYAFNKPTLWNFDFSMQMYGAILMMSGAYCLATEAHVRGDVIYRLFNQKTQAWIDLVLYFIFFFPGVIALAFYGYEYAAQAWKIKETSWSSPAQIQIYMVKSMIPAAGILLIIQGISEVFRSILCIKVGQWPARMVVAEETEKILMRTSQEEDNKNAV